MIACISYVLSAYTLTIWCARIPKLVRYAKRVKTENKYARRWFDDTHLRVKISLYGTLIWNIAYAVFQLWLGVYHSSFWFFSLAAYYFSIAVMRFFLVKYARKHAAGEKMITEYKRYRACGWVFLVTNLALAVIIFFMVYWGKTFVHHQVTTIAMAAYTFSAFTIAILNVIKYRKYQSPVYSASKVINLAAASVSMLTLETAMLSAFGDGSEEQMRGLLTTMTGAAVCVFILCMAIYMIVHANKELKKIN